MRTFLLLALSILGLLAAANGAGARERGEGGPPPFGPSDARSAGMRGGAILTGAAMVLVSFDSDADYATSRDEFEAGLARETERAFGGLQAMRPIAFDSWAAKALGGPALPPFRLAFDSNVDGQITRAEFAAALRSEFQRLDRNGDGKVTRAEMIETLPVPRDERRGPPDMRDRGRGPGPGGGPMQPPG